MKRLSPRAARYKPGATPMTEAEAWAKYTAEKEMKQEKDKPMTDITDTHLEAALLDQMVAGAFSDKDYAYVVVTAKGESGFSLGIAVANENGYNPIDGRTFKSEDEARRWADSLNRHIGLDRDTAWRIICSTMRGRRFEVSASLVAKGA